MLATNDNGGEGLHSKVSNIELTTLTPVLVEVSAFGSSVGDYVLTTMGTVGAQATQTIGEILRQPATELTLPRCLGDPRQFPQPPTGLHHLPSSGWLAVVSA